MLQELLRSLTSCPESTSCWQFKHAWVLEGFRDPRVMVLDDAMASIGANITINLKLKLVESAISLLVYLAPTCHALPPQGGSPRESRCIFYLP